MIAREGKRKQKPARRPNKSAALDRGAGTARKKAERVRLRRGE